MKVNALLSCLALAGSTAARVSYAGYKVVRLPVGTDASKLTEIVDRLQLTTWKGAPKAGTFADIVVPPEAAAAFDAETAGFEREVMHADLGISIDEEAAVDAYVSANLNVKVASVGAAAAPNATWFNAYHSYADHLAWLNDLAGTYPSQAKIVTAGNSLQGRPITGIHIFGSGGAGKKPAVVLHGTVHAREWVTTMTVEYFAFLLLTQYASNPETKAFVDKYDFVIFPVVNPDGFVYTQTNDRLWRKNRQSTAGSTCLGHDINRNWPFMWAVSGGASTNPCAQDFKGTSAGDAPETQALSSWLLKTKQAQGVKLFIDYHSYSQLFMTPYGYSCTATAVKHTELQSLARGAVAAIKAVHGKTYEYGPICTTIYPATGSSVDYVNDVVGADYTFTSELRDTGANGFVLPPAQILPTGQESWAGFVYLLKNMR